MLPSHWTPVDLSCSRCNHHWLEQIPFDVTLVMLAAQLKTQRCPECRTPARNIRIRLLKQRDADQ